MNDEIREILENCEKAINEASGYNNATNKIIDYIINLLQENEKLNIEKNDYKSRCEKAVEYIKTTKFLYKSHYDFKQDLLNILQNGSENNE